MNTTDNIRILTWNVRGYNLETIQLRDEIIRQKPHIVIMQETMAWIENDKILNWAGARVMNMEAIQQVKGKRGGLAIIVIPEIDFTELHRCAVGIDLDKLQKAEVEPEHIQLVNVSNVEECLPEDETNAE